MYHKEPLSTQNENKQTSWQLKLLSQDWSWFLSRAAWFLYTLEKPVRNSFDTQLKLALTQPKSLQQLEYIVAFGERANVFKNLQRSFISSYSDRNFDLK